MSIQRPNLTPNDTDHALTAPITTGAKEAPATCYACGGPTNSVQCPPSRRLVVVTR